MKRRNFLRTAGAASALTPLALKGFSISPMDRNSVFSQLAAAANINDRVMVFIELNGGNDGINTVIPLDQYDRLSNHRNNLLIPENQVLGLDGTPETGLHPVMGDLQNMYHDGLVSIVQNVGYPEQDYSHFRSMDIWMTGSSSAEYLNTGWLGRTLEGEYPGFPNGFPNADNPHPLAIQIGSILPVAFMGTAYPMGMSIGSPNELYDFVEDIIEPAPNTPYGDELEYIRLTMQQSEEYYEVIKNAVENSQNLSSKYPADGINGLADQLKAVARLIGGGLETSVYVVTIGGFDTHSEQVEGGPTEGFHAELLGRISQAVCAFQDDMELMGMADKVCGMTFSEFGRTIGENGSVGTDHGAAAPLIVFGRGVNPGIIGENPYIKTQIETSEDLPMVYDFRQVYASVLQDWFGLENAGELLFGDFEILPIFQGVTSTEESEKPLASAFEVENYPNPVRNTTTISFVAHGGGNVRIDLMDSSGRFVKKIVEGTYPSGPQQVRFSREGISGGNYFYRVSINGISITKQMLVL